jgi:hypothetical protein
MKGLGFIFSEARGNTYICVELANEAGEVTVLEVARKKDGGEFVRVPNDEAVASKRVKEMQKLIHKCFGFCR